MSMAIIEISNFHKKYHNFTAVSGINLQIEEGELFGLIGPDGAGKTTLMRSICTLIRPTEGNIKVCGYDTSNNALAIRRILGYMPQRFSLYQDLTVKQNLDFFADLFKVPQDRREERLEKLYHFSRLEPFTNRLAGVLSGGMKQKLALSCALIHTPKILVLDEPTYGIDPVSRQEFWEVLKSIQREGTTTFVSTAYMEESEICDRVALMHKGMLISRGKPQEIKDQYPYPLYRVEGENLYQLKQHFDNIAMIKHTQLFGNAIHISCKKTPTQTDWRNWQKETGKNLHKWYPQSPSMEDIFMELVKGEDI
jgi:ABC-2 type transport system ATP-binding protein